MSLVSTCAAAASAESCLAKHENAAYCYRRSVVCVSVCLLVTNTSCAKKDKLIEMSFRVWTRGAQGTMGVLIFMHGKWHSGARGNTWTCRDISAVDILAGRGSSDAASGQQY